VQGDAEAEKDAKLSNARFSYQEHNFDNKKSDDIKGRREGGLSWGCRKAL